MEKISVLILSKNSGKVIEDCIKSIKDLADEIIAVDGGSTDETQKIVEKLGGKFFTSEFKNFADQRNFAATLAHNPWIFYIDSDERASESFISEVRIRIKQVKEDVAGFWVKRKTFFFGKDWGLTDRVQRIFLKEKLKHWHGAVHETPEVEGVLETIEAPILHYTHRNLEQMVEKTNEWSDIEAELRLKSNHPKMNVWRFPRVMVTAFLGSYFGEKGYKNGTAGLIEAIYQAFSMFITYAKLWEKQSNGK